jgi:hypothetical protein
MAEKLTWLLEGILLLGVVAMFFADNKGLWVRPTSQGSDDDSHREIRSGQ